MGRAEIGSACLAPGGTVCDGEGRCVACLEDADCGDEQACSLRGNCVPISCANGELDPGETDVDCGGPLCEPCALGARCAEPSDCQSRYCAEADGGGSAEESGAAADGESGGSAEQESGASAEGESDATAEESGASADGESGATAEESDASAEGESGASAEDSDGARTAMRCSLCADDAQCAAGEICDPRTSTCERDLCVPNPCTRPPEPECEGDEVVEREATGDCRSTLLTVVCTYPEARRENCAAQGLVCSGGACVDPATAPATLRVDGAPLALQAGGSGSLRVVHVGGSEAALSVGLDVAGSSLSGRVTIDSSACGRIEPEGACTITLSAGPQALPPTRVVVSGENTNAVEVVVEILPGRPGDAAGGGIVVRMPSGGAAGLVAARSDLDAREWGSMGIVAGASSTQSGRANSQFILARLEPGFAPAAEACEALAVGAAGQSPCMPGEVCFDDWYLPSRSELLDVYAQRAAVGGFVQDFYWSSTEAFDAPANLAEAVNFLSGVVFDEVKAAEHRVRCVRVLR